MNTCREKLASPSKAVSNPEKLDVFSFGVLLWVLLTGKPPWANLANTEELRVLVRHACGDTLELCHSVTCLDDDCGSDLPV